MITQVKKWSDLVQIVSGKNQKSVANPNGQYPIYGSGGLIGYADNYLCEAGTTIVGRKGTINKPIFVTERFWNVDTAFGVSPGKALVPKYLFYFCEFFNFQALDKSTTIPSLAKSDLLKIEMPVPSILEQRHIVSRIEGLLSQLDSGVETLNMVKRQLVAYRQAIIREAFSKDYPQVPLGSISTAFGGYAFKSKLYAPDGSYVVVKIGNVKQGGFDFSRDLTRTNQVDDSILNRYLLKRGDCLITLTRKSVYPQAM